ncbi:MAG: RES family NAD+ phosphorylase, partial [Pseudolabrys sp.]
MSSSTWTLDALSSDAHADKGACWRVVEAQHYISTAKLTDTAEEQDRLESLIDASKPVVPEECRHLHYLFFTPFRYGAPYPRGSRFRRAGLSPGVFYSSVLSRTAVTELAFYRLLFYAESPATKWSAEPAEYTVFSAEYAVGRAI